MDDNLFGYIPKETMLVPTNPTTYLPTPYPKLQLYLISSYNKRLPLDSFQVS
jgi:hypothetical protein